MRPRETKFKKISNYQLSQFGFQTEVPEIVDSIDDLRKSSPNIVIAEALDTLFYKQNNYVRNQQLVKKAKYVMSLGVYKQLYSHPLNPKDKILKPTKPPFRNIYHPYRGEDLTNKTLLVWRQGGIGDLLFISPNLRYLKEKYPTCKINFACGPQYQSMIKEWKFIDKIIDLPFTMSELFQEKSNYHSIFEGVIERTREAEYENAYKLFTAWMGLNLPNELLFPEQEPNADSLIKCKELLDQWKIKDFIIIQMRASSPIRTPRPSIWKKIIDSLTEKGHKIILTDSPHKQDEVDKFILTLNNKENVFNYSKYSNDISDSIAMTSLAKFAIGVDSSLIHIAESVKVKSLGIFGAFPSEVRISTYRYASSIDCKTICSPCYTHGMNLCNRSREGYVTCFDNLNINDLIGEVEKNV